MPTITSLHTGIFCAVCRKEVKTTVHGTGMCLICWREREENGHLNDYGFKPTPYFEKSKKDNEPLYMGIELETDYKGVDFAKDRLKVRKYLMLLDISDRFYFKHDGTITGMEIVSHPTTLNKFKEYKFRNLFEYLALNNFTSYKTGNCGLHIHLSKDFFEEEEIRKLCVFFNNNNSNLFELSNRTEEKYNSWASPVKYNIKNYIKQNSLPNNRGALNLLPCNTIELRLFRGTLFFPRFMASLQFAEALSYFVKEYSTISMNWDKFTEYLKRNEKYLLLLNYLINIKKFKKLEEEKDF